MIKYKNISGQTLTFYNVTFNPNDIKEVPGYINHLKMIRVKDSEIPKPKATLEVVEEKQKVEAPAKRTYTKRKIKQS